MVFSESGKAGSVAATRVGFDLYFHRMENAVVFQYAIHFRAAMEPPMVKRRTGREQRCLFAEFRRHRCFKQSAKKRVAAQSFRSRNHLEHTGQAGIADKTLGSAADTFDHVA